MAGSSRLQHFFVAGCFFADFAIAVIFYLKLYAYDLGVATLRYQI